MELVLEAIKNAQNIEANEEEVEAQIKEQAESMGRDVEEFKASLTDEQKDYLKDSAAIQKVVALLKKDAKVTAPEAEEKPAKKKTTRKPAAKKEAEEAEATEAEAEEKKPAAKKTTTRKKKAEETPAE